MSFGLLTAIEVDDIPKILHRAAYGWRSVETKRNKLAWALVADEVDKFAIELVAKINEAKLKEPKYRIKL